MTSRGSNILGASVVSAVGTGISRVLGAARDVAISHVFGDRREAGAFFVAWTVPSVFRRFVADEGLTGALIPAVAQAEKTDGEAEARRLAGAALTALLIAAAVLVGGGILVHGIPALHHGIEHLAESVLAVPAAGALLPVLANGLVGVAAGVLVLTAVSAVQRLRGRAPA